MHILLSETDNCPLYLYLFYLRHTCTGSNRHYIVLFISTVFITASYRQKQIPLAIVMSLNLKGMQICSRRLSKTDFFFQTNKTWYFVWILCLAIDYSKEMSSFIFPENKKKNISAYIKGILGVRDSQKLVQTSNFRHISPFIKINSNDHCLHLGNPKDMRHLYNVDSMSMHWPRRHCINVMCQLGILGQYKRILFTLTST